MGEGYSWAPPGLSPARVEEYMRQLPSEKVPRVGGSQGEVYRDHQLKLQLPKQDLSSKYCSNLEPGHQVGHTLITVCMYIFRKPDRGIFGGE